MKTANISKIAIEIPQTKKAKFNLSHDNNTTYDWGSVQPTLCKMMQPDSSININDEQLIRMAPMVVPTFGRVKIKNIAHFIALEEIWPNWDAMLSQTKVTRTSFSSTYPTTVTYVPKKVPYIKNNILAAWCLAGCKANIYFSGAVGTALEDEWYCARNTGTWSTPTGWANATTAGRQYGNKLLYLANTQNPTQTTIPSLNYTGYAIRVNRIVRNADGTRVFSANSTAVATLLMPSITTMTSVPLPNANGNGYTHSFNNEVMYIGQTEDHHITFDSADMIWEYDGANNAGITAAERASGSGSPVEDITSNEFDGCKIRITFKLSSFGKRLRKVLIGLGYDVNLDNSDEVSLLPLIAYYKAYWDSYAPERTKNFYETNAWKLIQAAMANQNATDITNVIGAGNADVRDYLIGLLTDVGTAFATEKIDAVSAATDQYYGNTNTTTGVGGTNEIQTEVMSLISNILGKNKIASGVNEDGSANIQVTSSYQTTYGIGKLLATGNGQPVLTQPEITSLKKAYIMLNKSSVAGMTVADILRANGQGDYVEECNGKFIDVNEDTIKISDVVATAATEQASLGQYGGRGLGLNMAKFNYTTGRYGYIIILSTIIPESGYINAPMHENQAISFEKLYNPEFDGLAYEAIEKKTLGGSPLINDPTYKNTFGYLPTYSQWKFMGNKANGDFSLNSRKTYMTPYTLDKYIPIGDANVYEIHEDSNHNGTTVERCSPRFTYADLANAGEDYRYINKFPWNGNYNRIFETQDDGIEWSVYSPNNNSFLFNAFEYDNFMVHHVFEIAYWAHMKPIEESYGTYDEEHGAPDTTIKRS